MTRKGTEISASACHPRLCEEEAYTQKGRKREACVSRYQEGDTQS